MKRIKKWERRSAFKREINGFCLKKKNRKVKRDKESKK